MGAVFEVFVWNRNSANSGALGNSNTVLWGCCWLIFIDSLGKHFHSVLPKRVPELVIWCWVLFKEIQVLSALKFLKSICIFHVCLMLALALIGQHTGTPGVTHLLPYVSLLPQPGNIFFEGWGLWIVKGFVFCILLLCQGV